MDLQDLLVTREAQANRGAPEVPETAAPPARWANPDSVDSRGLSDSRAHKVELVRRAVKVRKGHRGHLANRGRMDSPELKASLDHPDRQDHQERLDFQDPLVTRAVQELQALQVNLDHLDPLDRLVMLEPKDNLVHLAALVLSDQPAHKET